MTSAQHLKRREPVEDIEFENESDYEDDDELLLDEDEEEDDIDFIDEEDEEEEPPPKRPGGGDEMTGFRDFVNPLKTLPQATSAVYDQASPAASAQGASAPSAAAAAPTKAAAMPMPNRPSDGYASLEEEKIDLLFKLDRLRKRGMPVKALDYRSDIVEIRAEVTRAKTEIELDSSIQFSRKMLMAVVSVMEFANKRWDPFDLQLDGWSESVMQGIDNYDNVLEKLYYKYRNRVSMPPEMELMLSLAGSAFMFHMTNSMFKAALPGGGRGGPGLSISPDMLRSMMGAFAPQQQAPPPPPPPPTTTQPQPEYTMKGPAMDLGPLMSMMGGGFPLPVPTSLASAPEPPARPMNDALFPPPPPIRTAPPPPAAAAPPASGPPPQPAAAYMDDRLSDIISEDLESVASDLPSIPGSEEGNIRNVILTPGAPKKGRGRARGKVNGKVMEI